MKPCEKIWWYLCQPVSVVCCKLYKYSLDLDWAQCNAGLIWIQLFDTLMVFLELFENYFEKKISSREQNSILNCPAFQITQNEHNYPKRAKLPRNQSKCSSFHTIPVHPYPSFTNWPFTCIKINILKVWKNKSFDCLHYIGLHTRKAFIKIAC